MTIETKELVISEELKKKVDMICRFACVKYELINSSVNGLKNTNIAYTKPHILKANDVRNKNINVIVAFKLDRLTRSVYDIEKLMKVVNDNECD